MKAKDHDDAWNKQHQFEKPSAWIQWKGTEVCMDIHCICGHLGHVDGEFAYHVQCTECGRVYFCNGHIQLIEMEDKEETPQCCLLTDV